MLLARIYDLGCADKRLEQRIHTLIRRDQAFRMPLYADHERVVLALNRLDHAVGRIRRYAKTIRQLIDSLVMEAVDRAAVAQQLRQARTRNRRDAVSHVIARLLREIL